MEQDPPHTLDAFNRAAKYPHTTRPSDSFGLFPVDTSALLKATKIVAAGDTKQPREKMQKRWAECPGCPRPLIEVGGPTECFNLSSLEPIHALVCFKCKILVRVELED